MTLRPAREQDLCQGKIASHNFVLLLPSSDDKIAHEPESLLCIYVDCSLSLGLGATVKCSQVQGQQNPKHWHERFFLTFHFTVVWLYIGYHFLPSLAIKLSSTTDN